MRISHAELALDLGQAPELLGGDVAEAAVRVRAHGAVGPAAHHVGGVPLLQGREPLELHRRGARADEAAVGADRGAHAGGSVALLLHDRGDPARVGRRRGEELPLLDDPLAQLVDPHRVDQPLHAGAQLVVAVAVVVLHPQHRFDGGQQVLARRELLERLGRVRVRAQATRHEHAEAGLEGAVGARAVHRDDAGVVEHRLAAVGGAAGEVDLELAGEPLRDRVAQEEVLGGLGPRADVEHLVGARAGEMAARHVAHGVAARFAAGEPDRREEAQDLGRLLELHEVELHVLAGREVTPAAREVLGDVARASPADPARPARRGSSPAPSGCGRPGAGRRCPG